MNGTHANWVIYGSQHVASCMNTHNYICFNIQLIVNVQHYVV